MAAVITNRDRAAIRKQLVARAFDAQGAALRAEENQLFDTVCDMLVGEHKDVINLMPSGFFQEQMRFNLGWSDFYGVDMLPEMRTINGAWPRRLPAKFQLEPDDDYEVGDVDYEYVVLPHRGRHAIAEYLRKQKKYLEARQELDEQLTATLASFRGWKKLFEAWPELATLKLAAAPPEAPTNQLTVDFASLNKVLRLPPTEGEA